MISPNLEHTQPDPVADLDYHLDDTILVCKSVLEGSWNLAWRAGKLRLSLLDKECSSLKNKLKNLTSRPEDDRIAREYQQRYAQYDQDRHELTKLGAKLESEHKRLFQSGRSCQLGQEQPYFNHVSDSNFPVNTKTTAAANDNRQATPCLPVQPARRFIDSTLEIQRDSLNIPPDEDPSMATWKLFMQRRTASLPLPPQVTQPHQVRTAGLSYNLGDQASNAVGAAPFGLGQRGGSSPSQAAPSIQRNPAQRRRLGEFDSVDVRLDDQNYFSAEAAPSIQRNPPQQRRLGEFDSVDVRLDDQNYFSAEEHPSRTRRFQHPPRGDGDALRHMASQGSSPRGLPVLQNDGEDLPDGLQETLAPPRNSLDPSPTTIWSYNGHFIDKCPSDSTTAGGSTIGTRIDSPGFGQRLADINAGFQLGCADKPSGKNSSEVARPMPPSGTVPLETGVFAASEPLCCPKATNTTSAKPSGNNSPEIALSSSESPETVVPVVNAGSTSACALGSALPVVSHDGPRLDNLSHHLDSSSHLRDIVKAAFQSECSKGQSSLDLAALRRVVAKGSVHFGVPVKELFRDIEDEYIRFDFNGDSTLQEHEAYRLVRCHLQDYRKRSGHVMSAVKVPSRTPEDVGYRIVQHLGKGGQGACKLVLDPFGERHCLKMLEKTGKMAQIDELKEELAILSHVQNKHIIKIHSIFQDDDKFYIACEPYFGSDFTKLRANAKSYGVAMTETWWRNIFLQCFHGLLYMHKHALMHCDVKEANIMLKRMDLGKPEIVFIDFGLAQEFPHAQRAICGTPGYIPPETWKAFKWFPKGDVFSMGVTMLQMLAGGNIEIFVEGARSFPDGFKDVETFTLSRNAPLNLLVDFPRSANLIGLLVEKDMRNRITAFQALEHTWLRGHLEKDVSF